MAGGNGIISCMQSHHHLNYPINMLLIVSQHVHSVTTLLVRNISADSQAKLWTRPSIRSHRTQKCKQTKSLSNLGISYQKLTKDSWDFLLESIVFMTFLTAPNSSNLNILSVCKDAAALSLHLTKAKLLGNPCICCPVATAVASKRLPTR